jgi:SAM-dependent methyltransferase
MTELLIGCGNSRKRCFAPPPDWTDLVTLDSDPDCGADVEWDLERMPLPFPDDKFDEIHAYHTLEHLGRQGDYRFFFAQWSEFYRLLKPGGVFFGIVPGIESPWLWGDPGHTRVITPEMLTFLHQPAYTDQVGKTALADYRRVYRADFELLAAQTKDLDFYFAVQAVKPSRISR